VAGSPLTQPFSCSLREDELHFGILIDLAQLSVCCRVGFQGRSRGSEDDAVLRPEIGALYADVFSAGLRIPDRQTGIVAAGQRIQDEVTGRPAAAEIQVPGREKGLKKGVILV